MADESFGERDVTDLQDSSGWARVERLWLVDEDLRERAIEDALIIAVRTADDTPELYDDFDVEVDSADGVTITRITRFLAAWLPELPRASTIVLFASNPHAARLTVPGVQMFVPTGDVTCSIDAEAIKLAAESWAKAR